MIKDPKVIQELTKLFKEASVDFVKVTRPEKADPNEDMVGVDLNFVQRIVDQFNSNISGDTYHVSTEAEACFCDDLDDKEDLYLDPSDPAYDQDKHLVKALGEVILNTVLSKKTLDTSAVDNIRTLDQARAMVIQYAK